LAPSGGCGALVRLGGKEPVDIAFTTGELRSTEKASLDQLEAACSQAIDRLGYEEVEAEREADQIRYRARTAGGEPVNIRVVARGPKRTDLRIRIGVSGDETTSRLVLEEIHQSL
jgi:Protein of unknown function (DUF3568)